jgi:hypothetical protein
MSSSYNIDHQSTACVARVVDDAMTKCLGVACERGNRDVEWVGTSSKRFGGRVVRPVVRIETLSADEGDAPQELQFCGLPMRRVRHPAFDAQLGAS